MTGRREGASASPGKFPASDALSCLQGRGVRPRRDLSLTVQRAGLDAADRLIDSITDRVWLLGEHPDAGRPSDDIDTGVNGFPAGKYLTYYRRTRCGTEILRIFHGARDQKLAFK